MKKSILSSLFSVLFLSQVTAQVATASDMESKPKPKLLVGVNLGAATLNYRAAFATEITYGVKYKRHFIGFNYNSNESKISDKEYTSVISKPVYNYMNFGYLQQYSFYQEDKHDLALSFGVAYAEFGLKDLSTSSFFHTGNMLNMNRLISLAPGVNYQYGVLNLCVQYRHSFSVKNTTIYDHSIPNSLNVINPSMTNGLTATIGIRFEVDK